MLSRRFLRSATTNRLTVPPVKLTTVANQPGFLGCRPTDLQRFDRRRDVCQIVIHFSSKFTTLLDFLFYFLDYISTDLVDLHYCIT